MGRLCDELKMKRPFLVIGASAFILTCGALNAGSQEYPEYQRMQPQIQQPQELERQGAQPRRRVENDNKQNDDGYGRATMGRGWRYHQDWLRGGMGPGMMASESMRGPASMGSGMMMRMIFTLMDGDGDGSLSLEEFQAAHARIFKGMDANKDGSLTMEEMQAFMQGARRSAPRQ